MIPKSSLVYLFTKNWQRNYNRVGNQILIPFYLIKYAKKTIFEAYKTIQ